MLGLTDIGSIPREFAAGCRRHWMADPAQHQASGSRDEKCVIRWLLNFQRRRRQLLLRPFFRGEDQAIYEMLKNHTEYHDLGADYLDQLQRERVKRHLVNRLEGLGYQVNLKELPGKAVA